MRELAGGFTLSTHADVEPAARRLLAKPRTPPLTPAQAETLAIVAYLQPVSRPEIARIRGVSAESAAATLLERGHHRGGRPLAVRRRPVPHHRAVPEAVRAALARSSCPPIEGFDPSPELEQELRDRLLRAGEARAGVVSVAGATAPAAAPEPSESDDDDG